MFSTGWASKKSLQGDVHFAFGGSFHSRSTDLFMYAGDIAFLAGQRNEEPFYGGYILLHAGNGTDEIKSFGGNFNATGGNAVTGSGGSIQLSTGSSVQTSSGEISIHTKNSGLLGTSGSCT